MNKLKKMMIAVIVLLSISSLSILLTYFGYRDGNFINRFLVYAVPITFFVFMIAGYVVLFFTNSERKIVQEKEQNSKQASARSNRKQRPTKGLPGAFRILTNKYATIFDLLSALFLILTVVFSFIPLLRTASIATVSFLVLCLQMHSILNGVNFTYIFYNNKRGDRGNEKK